MKLLNKLGLGAIILASSIGLNGCSKTENKGAILNKLEYNKSENGSEMSDEELNRYFITPYSKKLIKKPREIIIDKKMELIMLEDLTTEYSNICGIPLSVSSTPYSKNNCGELVCIIEMNEYNKILHKMESTHIISMTGKDSCHSKNILEAEALIKAEMLKGKKGEVCFNGDYFNANYYEDNTIFEIRVVEVFDKKYEPNAKFKYQNGKTLRIVDLVNREDKK